MLYPVITIRQPWAALIVNGIKDVENRNWRLPDKYRNCTVLVHASANPSFDLHAAKLELFNRDLPFVDFAPATTVVGSIIGAVRFSSCHWSMHHKTNGPITPWCDTESAFWWMIEKAIPVGMMFARGKLRFWQCDYPHNIMWPGDTK